MPQPIHIQFVTLYAYMYTALSYLKSRRLLPKLDPVTMCLHMLSNNELQTNKTADLNGFQLIIEIPYCDLTRNAPYQYGINALS